MEERKGSNIRFLESISRYAITEITIIAYYEDNYVFCSYKGDNKIFLPFGKINYDISIEENIMFISNSHIGCTAIDYTILGYYSLQKNYKTSFGILCSINVLNFKDGVDSKIGNLKLISHLPLSNLFYYGSIDYLIIQKFGYKCISVLL